MEQKLFTPHQLLKSNDGKEYIVFKYYLKDDRKCEECTPFFRGHKLGYEFSILKRATENFHVVSDVERHFIDDATDYRRKTANAYSEAKRKLFEIKVKEANLKSLSGLNESVASILDMLDGMTKGIDDVIRYTAKDYIKGETVKKDLNNIRKILERMRKATKSFHVEGGGNSANLLSNDDPF